jgi:2'-5' RNA ligase
MRTFIAIELDEPARRVLLEAQENLRRGPFDVKWVEAANLHLTLEFLGEVDEARCEDVRKAMERAASGTAPFVIEIAGLGSFPPRRPPRVIWAGVIEKTGTLSRLHERLVRELERSGIEREKEEAFHAHVTIGRVRSPRGARELERALTEIRLATAHVDVRALMLKRSELGREGPRYSDLGKAHLDLASGSPDPGLAKEKETRSWQ